MTERSQSPVTKIRIWDGPSESFRTIPGAMPFPAEGFDQLPMSSPFGSLQEGTTVEFEITSRRNGDPTPGESIPLAGGGQGRSFEL
jgi:hypothetical protein